MSYVTGDSYTGDFVEDRKSGNGNIRNLTVGIQNYANGDKYDGQWVDNKRHGNGIIN